MSSLIDQQLHSHLNTEKNAAFWAASYYSITNLPSAHYQGNDVITTGTTTHVGNGKNVGTLEFSSLSVSDAGDYKCSATEAGREVLSSGTVTLTVLGMCRLYSFVELSS